MVNNLKSAKATFKVVKSDGEKLLARVSNDLDEFKKDLQFALYERISNMEGSLLEVAKMRDTISAGLSETRRELDRVHKRLGKSKPDLGKARDSVIEIAEKLGESRKVYEEMRRELEHSLNERPTPQGLIEKVLEGFYSATVNWEGDARKVEDGFANVVDCSLPKEIKELESEILNNGYSVLLAGENRKEENINKFNDKLSKIMNPNTDSKQNANSA